MSLTSVTLIAIVGTAAPYTAQLKNMDECKEMQTEFKNVPDSAIGCYRMSNEGGSTEPLPPLRAGEMVKLFTGYENNRLGRIVKVVKNDDIELMTLGAIIKPGMSHVYLVLWTNGTVSWNVRNSLIKE